MNFRYTNIIVYILRPTLKSTTPFNLGRKFLVFFLFWVWRNFILFFILKLLFKHKKIYKKHIWPKLFVGLSKLNSAYRLLEPFLISFKCYLKDERSCVYQKIFNTNISHHLCEFTALEHKFKRSFCTQKLVLNVRFKILGIQK